MGMKNKTQTDRMGVTVGGFQDTETAQLLQIVGDSVILFLERKS